ncbi:50S ribosomal protein L30 [Candidatus Thorarchaeota archaeon]|nr:MAG: 50S ribosomal protein L30 [Candidatus Thorarchaeota archaeon]
MSEEDSPVILVIRVRGQVRVRPQIKHTLEKLKLGRLHHARILKMTPSVRGMINKAKDYLTWGEVDEETVVRLLDKRGRLSGNRRLTDEYVKKQSDYKSVKALAKAIAAGEADLYTVEGVKPIFRLTPPSGGYKGKTAQSFEVGGVTGYRGEAISELAMKMI